MLLHITENGYARPAHYEYRYTYIDLLGGKQHDSFSTEAAIASLFPSFLEPQKHTKLMIACYTKDIAIVREALQSAVMFSIDLPYCLNIAIDRENAEIITLLCEEKAKARARRGLSGIISFDFSF